ncbi:hypothetical protein Tco_0862876, partial [Tanacetum coccineum]
LSVKCCETFVGFFWEAKHQVSFMRILRLREVARVTARIALEFAPDYSFSVSLLLTPLCCDDIHYVTPRVSALAGCDINAAGQLVNTASPEVNTGHFKLNTVDPSASQKEVGTLRYLSLVVPLKKVGDEAVHKELGDRMERAATTASSLEAEQESGNINKTQSMATLNGSSP